ncbi:hypothetical protein N9L18_01010 [Candidatus Pacebacteria bacterium]|nr:hypothetical protein [Candidatus Paceibacterota bacterium]
MSLFGSKEIKAERKLLLDIRSSSVSAAILNTGPEIPEIEYFAQNVLSSSIDSGENTERFIKEMLVLVDKTLEEVSTKGLLSLSEKDKKIKIKEVLVTYGSPWNKVFTRDLKIKKEKEFVLTKDKFDKLVEQQIKIEEEKAKGKRVIEKDVTHVILNGYELTDPFDKKAKELTISFYVSFISEKILKSVEDSLDKHFHKIKVTNRTFPIILFSSIRNTLINASTFSFFDISGEVTDFGIVDRGSLIFTGSIPMGKNHIIREVAKNCKMENSSTSSILSLLAKDEANESCNANIKEALEKVEQNWINEMKKSFETAGLSVPKRSFITVDNEGSEIFSKTLNKPFSRRNLFETEQEVQVVVLGEEKLRKFINKKDGTKPNPHICLVSVFLSNLET